MICPAPAPQFAPKLYFAGSVSVSTSDQLVLCYATGDFSPEEESNPEANVSYRGWVSRPSCSWSCPRAVWSGLGVEKIQQKSRNTMVSISLISLPPYLALGIPIIVPSYLSNAVADSRALSGLCRRHDSKSCRIVEIDCRGVSTMVERVREFLLKEAISVKSIN